MAKKKQAKSKKKDRFTLLAEAAVELNEELGLDPEIEVEDVSEAELEEKLAEAAGLVTEEDEFSEATTKILEEFIDEDDDDEDDEIEDDDEESDEDDDESDSDEADDSEEGFEFDIDEVRAFVKGAKSVKTLRKYMQDNPELFDSVNPNTAGRALQKEMLAWLDEVEDSAEEAEDQEEPAEEPKAKKKPAKKEKKAPAKKAEKKAPAKKPAAKKKAAPAKKKSGPSTLEVVGKLIKAGKSTRKEIIDQVTEELGVSAGTVSTIITDGKNPKYNRFDKLVKINKKGNVVFEK